MWSLLRSEWFFFFVCLVVVLIEIIKFFKRSRGKFVGWFWGNDRIFVGVFFFCYCLLSCWMCVLLYSRIESFIIFDRLKFLKLVIVSFIVRGVFSFSCLNIVFRGRKLLLFNVLFIIMGIFIVIFFCGGGDEEIVWYCVVFFKFGCIYYCCCFELVCIMMFWLDFLNVESFVWGERKVGNGCL